MLFPWSLLILQGASLVPSKDESPSSPPVYSDRHSSVSLEYLVSAWPGWKSRLPTGPLLVGKRSTVLSAVFGWSRAVIV